MDVAVDNSALSRLTDDATRRRFIRTILDRDARLVVPVVVLCECLTHEDVAGVEARARMVVAVGRELGECAFILGEDWHAIAREEWRGRKLERTRSLPRWLTRGVLGTISAPSFRNDHPEWLPQLRAYMAKEQSLKLDASARTYLEENALIPGATDLERELLNPFAERVLGGGRYPLALFSKGSAHRRRARRSPQAFPATVMMASYFYLIALGALFVNHGYGRYTALLRGPQRGSWVDARTAAASVYARRLITNDRNQREKVNFIAAELGLAIRAMSLDEFLTGVREREHPSATTSATA